MPCVCITLILVCGYFNLTGSFLISDSPNYDFHSVQAKGVESQQQYHAMQYSDSFMPLVNLFENGNGNGNGKDIDSKNDLTNNNNPVEDSPSTPSLFSSKLTVSGSDSGIKSDTAFKNSNLTVSGSDSGIKSDTNGENNGIDIADINKDNPKIDSKCDSNVPIKIGYVITGSGHITGTNKDNYIIGSEDNDKICAKKGNDIVMALGGNDLVYTGQGDDTSYGGEGNNQLFGEDGDDNVIGGVGDDLLSGGKGNDHLAGVEGDDTMIGEAGANFFDCGEGMDTIIDYNPSKGDVISNNCEIVNNIDQRK